MSQIHHECELERHIVERLAASGWRVGQSAGYDRARALYPEDVLGWLEDTQPHALAKLHALHGEETSSVVLDRLVKQLESKNGGTVNVLRYGFAVAGGGTLAMSQARPGPRMPATTQSSSAIPPIACAWCPNWSTRWIRLTRSTWPSSSTAYRWRRWN